MNHSHALSRRFSRSLSGTVAEPLTGKANKTAFSHALSGHSQDHSHDHGGPLQGPARERETEWRPLRAERDDLPVEANPDIQRIPAGQDAAFATGVPAGISSASRLGPSTVCQAPKPSGGWCGVGRSAPRSKAIETNDLGRTANEKLTTDARLGNSRRAGIAR